MNSKKIFGTRVFNPLKNGKSGSITGGIFFKITFFPIFIWFKWNSFWFCLPKYYYKMIVNSHQSWFSEDLSIDNIPSIQPEKQHPKKQDQFLIVLKNHTNSFVSDQREYTTNFSANTPHTKFRLIKWENGSGYIFRSENERHRTETELQTIGNINRNVHS